MINKEPFHKLIDQLKSEGKYRVFNDILRERGDFPKAIWYGPYNIKNIVNWCSNDYLGMGQHRVVIDAMRTALDQTGAGSGGTRNIGGTSHYHVALEHELATLHKKSGALLFSSAYVANEWTLIALSKIIPNIEFVSDSKNHASLIEGIRHSRKPKHIFKHNDLDDLKEKLEKVEGTPCLVLESVYSMDGDVSHLADIIKISRMYGAIVYVDEVHAVGLYGPSGGGVIEQLGLEKEVDIVNGTLGKAFGVQGGYISADKTIIDGIRSIASGFIFTTSLSPVLCAGALSAVKYLKEHSEVRDQHQRRASKLKQIFKDNHIPLMENQTHIVPVMVNNAVRCKEISDILLNEHGHYVQAINYPTVDVGTERLRFAPTPFHTDAMMDDLVAHLRTLV